MVMALKFLSIFSLIILSPVIFLDVFAEEPILISISSDIDQAVFDGKWTSTSEWKRSSYDKIEFSDLKKIHLKTTEWSWRVDAEHPVYPFRILNQAPFPERDFVFLLTDQCYLLDEPKFYYRIQEI